MATLPKLYAFVTILALGLSSSFAYVQSRRFVRAFQQHTKNTKMPYAFRTKQVLKYSEEDATGIPSNSTSTTLLEESAQERFDKTATTITGVDDPCILTFENKRYNLTSYAKAHPGGHKILQKFHERDMTMAFHKVGHSRDAYEILSEYVIEEDEKDGAKAKASDTNIASSAVEYKRPSTPRWRLKLFTMEDPIGVHKYLGLYCLLHFIFRMGQMMFQDPSSGFGTRLGKGHSLISLLSVLPHALLSLSSLIFHTVPRERVVGKPMIWQENRAHSIIFALRSIVTTILWSLAIRFKESPGYRRFTLIATSFTVLLTLIGADVATHYLRADTAESTTATMPYWDDCSIETQKRFKSFYAMSQFGATIACMGFANPAMSFFIVFPIQFASFLLTLSRKGLIASKPGHCLYAGSLASFYPIMLRWIWCMRNPYPLAIPGMALGMYQLRRLGVNKYVLWLPLMAASILFGDKLMFGHAW